MARKPKRDRDERKPSAYHNRIAAILGSAEKRLGYSTKTVDGSIDGAENSQTVDSQAVCESFRLAGYSTLSAPTESTTSAASTTRGSLTRPAVPRDWIAISALEQLCYPAEPWSMSDTHGKLIQANLQPGERSRYFHPTHFLVLPNLKGTPIGYIAYRVFAGYVRVDRLGVHPRHRKKGIGTILLDAMIALVAEANQLAELAWSEMDAEKFNAANLVRAVEVNVRERELPAQLFLKSNGFVCQRPVQTAVRKPAPWNPNELGPFEPGDSVYPFIRILGGNAGGNGIATDKGSAK